MQNRTQNRRVKAAPRVSNLAPLAWVGLTSSNSLKLLTLIGFLLISGLAVVYLTYQNRYLFNELQQLRNQANHLDVQWGQLLIEQSTFGLEGRIEQKAVEQLELQVPDLSRIIMVVHD